MKPIDREIFNKMIFCDEVFHFLNLEETLYFTKLDIDFNSVPADTKIDERLLLDINQNNLSKAFSCNIKGVKSAGRGTVRPSDEEIKKLVDEHVSKSHEVMTEVFSQIN